jgi:hypothetical protein
MFISRNKLSLLVFLLMILTSLSAFAAEQEPEVRDWIYFFFAVIAFEVFLFFVILKSGLHKMLLYDYWYPPVARKITWGLFWLFSLGGIISATRWLLDIMFNVWISIFLLIVITIYFLVAFVNSYKQTI